MLPTNIPRLTNLRLHILHHTLTNPTSSFFSAALVRQHFPSKETHKHLLTHISLLFYHEMKRLSLKSLKFKPLYNHAILTATIIMVMLQTLCLANINNHHPIILVPGSGGNQLEARLKPDYNPSSWICKAYPGPIHKDKDGWYRIWFDPTVLVGPYTKCFAERMMLHYDPVSDDYFNAPGVETRVPRFGSTESLSYLDPNLKSISAYMAPLVQSLEEIGYIKSKTLFGAPYDFRYGLAPQGHPCQVGSKYLQDLKGLIESASASNGGKPVILISHSLGGLFVHQLLLQNTPSWRKKFIKHFVALSTPWGGTVQEMLTFASGYTLGVPLVNPLLVRQEQRSSESNLWLMPSATIFGHVRPLVITTNANYTAKDIPKFLNDIGFSQGVYPYTTRVMPLVEKLKAPEVPITCIIGSGVNTPETLFYDAKGFDKQPSIIWGDGDGTVNLLSLLAVQSEWMNQKNQPLKMIKIKGVSHTDVLSDQRSIDQILGVVSDVNSDVSVLHSAFVGESARIANNKIGPL